MLRRYRRKMAFGPLVKIFRYSFPVAPDWHTAAVRNVRKVGLDRPGSVSAKLRASCALTDCDTSK